MTIVSPLITQINYTIFYSRFKNAILKIKRPEIKTTLKSNDLTINVLCHHGGRFN